MIHYTVQAGATQTRLKGPKGARLQPGELAVLAARLPVHGDMHDRQFAILRFRRQDETCEVAVFEDDLRTVEI